MDDDLNPGTRQSIADRINSGDQMTGDFEQDAKKGLFNEFKETPYDFGLTGQRDAITNKARAKFLDPAIADIKAVQKASYAGEVQKKMKSTQQMALAQMRYDNARALAAQQRLAQEEAQRAQMISGLFQVAGTAAGAYFGGPAGAAAGGAAGGAVGNQAAGSNSSAGASQYKYGPR